MQKQFLEGIVTEVVDAAFQVHKTLGPGLLESAYQKCLAYELASRGLKVETEVEQPISYDGLELDCGYRIDLFIEDELIVELKAVEEIHPVHLAQILTYLKLQNKGLGLLINFNVPLIKNGIKRVVNDY